MSRCNDVYKGLPYSFRDAIFKELEKKIGVTCGTIMPFIKGRQQRPNKKDFCGKYFCLSKNKNVMEIARFASIVVFGFEQFDGFEFGA